jgi:hypothetical protein
VVLERKEGDVKAFYAAALAATLLHITPTVVLVERPAAVAQLLPGADKFFAREVHLADADAHKLHVAVDWGPPDDILTFFTGRAGVETVGVLQFVRVDTPHGPVEVAVSFDPHGVVHGVVVTKATVETKPWMLEALRAGLAGRYQGLKPDDTPRGAEAIRGTVGDLAYFIAQQVDKGVARALAAYHLFYAK